MISPLRINFVLPYYTPTPIGGYRVVYEYADFLAARGHAVTIVFPRRLLPPAKAPAARFPAQAPVGGTQAPAQPSPGALACPASQGPAGPRRGSAGWLDARRRRDHYHRLVHRNASGRPASRKWKEILPNPASRDLECPKDEVNATWRLPLRKIVISRWLEEIGTRIGATDIRHIPNGLDLGRFRVTAPSDRRPMSLYHHQAIKGVPDALAVLRRYHERFPHIPVSMFEVPPRGPDMPVWIDYFQEPTQDDLVARIYNKNAVYLGASLAEG